MSKLFTGDGSGRIKEIEEKLKHYPDVKEIACSLDAIKELSIVLIQEHQKNNPIKLASENIEVLTSGYIWKGYALSDGRCIPVRTYPELQGLTWEIR